MPQPSVYARMARLSAIIMILPASMLAGWVLGYGVDWLIGSFPIAAIVGTLFGAAAGFYEIVRILVPRESNGRPHGEG